MTVKEIHRLSKIDPWFLAQVEDLVQTEQRLQSIGRAGLDREGLRALKRKGFSDRRIGN
jgi:carbamoyl-phosphate synthase large subunit